VIKKKKDTLSQRVRREGCIQELSIQAIRKVVNEDLGHVGAANNLGIVKLKVQDSIYGIKRNVSLCVRDKRM
jgi:hypothetical protein